jgi:hypothetical protein
VRDFGRYLKPLCAGNGTWASGTVSDAAGNWAVLTKNQPPDIVRPYSPLLDLQFPFRNDQEFPSWQRHFTNALAAVGPRRGFGSLSAWRLPA